MLWQNEIINREKWSGIKEKVKKNWNSKKKSLISQCITEDIEKIREISGRVLTSISVQLARAVGVICHPWRQYEDAILNTKFKTIENKIKVGQLLLPPYASNSKKMATINYPSLKTFFDGLSSKELLQCSGVRVSVATVSPSIRQWHLAIRNEKD